MDNGYQILINKLDAFIKKYYINKIIKGLILSLSVYAIWYLIVVIAEYFGRFSTTFRTILFIISVVFYIFIFITMILIPVLNLFKIGKVINYKQASRILGQHFPEIADKLQNTLELHELVKDDSDFKDLIIASINQRTLKLSPIPFVSAINLKNNLKYLKYLIPSVTIIILLFIFWPSVLSDATERIINYNKHYEAPAPFRFELLNDSLFVKKGQDYNVRIRTVGDITPDQVLISYAGNDFYMEKESGGVFKYNFRNLNNNIKFSLSAMTVNSRDYYIEVLPAPMIIDFKILVNPPAYTGIGSETYNNSGDITIPLGSQVQWIFNTVNINDLTVTFDTIGTIAEKNESQFSVVKKILRSQIYSLNVKNENFDEKTGITYQINVIPDLYPGINVRNVVDSTQLAIVYFNGFIDDDYGFSDLTFNCIPGEKSDSLIKIKIPFSKNLTSQDFYFAFDFSSIEVKGRNISYYFEVSDNDGVNGAKRTKTRMMEFIIPTAGDLQDMSEQANKDTEEKMEEAKKLSTQIRKDIENLQKKLINEPISTWERNQMMQQIFDNQTRLENLMNEVTKQQNEVQQYKEQFSRNEEILKKQEEINKLFDSLMDEEMRKLMEELQKLMQEFNKDEFFKLAEDMKFSSEEMEKQMDNTIELLKKSEIEERLKNSAEQLKNLSEEHQKLSEETKNKDISKEELLKKQEEHSDEFKKIMEDYEKTLEKNKDLKEPMNLDDLQQEMQEISELFEQSKEEIKENKNGKASKSQKQNSQNMQSMSEKIDNALADESMGQMAENIDDIRQIIENLLYFSFDQEDILKELKGLSPRDPKFKEYMIKQKNAQDNFDIIRDSLNSMAGRIPMLGPLVNIEISKIYRNLKIIMDEISDNRRYQVEASQQLVMTSANNLALLLLELMEQMQQDMANMQQKGGGQCNNCKNPGSGEPQMGKMRDMQQKLKQQMQDMINQMQDGGNKPGGSQGRSEQLAKMLMQQEMLQKMLNDAMSGGTSPDAAKILNQVNKMMEENLKDIINGNITPQTVNRQEQIITRLLQAENSEREREVDNKRKSNEAKDYKLSNPDAAFREKEQEIRFNELLQMSNLRLNNYYKNRYKEYLKKLGQN
jgi:hypothetical protein